MGFSESIARGAIHWRLEGLVDLHECILTMLLLCAVDLRTVGLVLHLVIMLKRQAYLRLDYRKMLRGIDMFHESNSGLMLYCFYP